MGKRGPTPAHERIRALPGREERRPPPPADLTEAQAGMWREIVTTEPAHLFDSAARRHLLRLYVEHAAFRASLQGLIDRSPVEAMVDPATEAGFERMLRARDRETKQLVSLATRLRLTKARYTAAAAGSAARNDSGAGPRPWDDSPAAEYFG
jgi:hypothetical protein